MKAEPSILAPNGIIGKLILLYIGLKLLPYAIGLVMYFFVWLGSGN